MGGYAISESTFVIAASGFADGPAQALRDYLLAHDAKTVTVIAHPLVAEGEGRHLVTTYAGIERSARSYRLPNRPPYTYLFDPFVPLRLPSSTAWFGFNNLAALRGLARRRRGATRHVYYWAVDFVPDRFGAGLATTVYDRVDRIVCANVDARIELAESALRARSERLRLGARAAPALVVPMGAWVERSAETSCVSWSEQRLVYLGHLVERQGVANLIAALPLLLGRHPRLSLEVVGGGPLESRLREQASAVGVSGRVSFHGFVPEHRQVEAILARGTVAVAPYLREAGNFTRYADPGKLKVYLGLGLPVVLTDVPPNAGELEAAGAAVLSDGTPAGLAASIERLLGDEARWLAAHRSALEYARRFDWNVLGWQRDCASWVVSEVGRVS